MDFFIFQLCSLCLRQLDTNICPGCTCLTVCFQMSPISVCHQKRWVIQEPCDLTCIFTILIIFTMFSILFDNFDLNEEWWISVMLFWIVAMRWENFFINCFDQIQSNEIRSDNIKSNDGEIYQKNCSCVCRYCCWGTIISNPTRLN